MERRSLCAANMLQTGSPETLIGQKSSFKVYGNQLKRYPRRKLQQREAFCAPFPTDKKKILIF